MIDKIVSVDFSLEVNGEKSISTHEYIELMKDTKSYIVGSGKNVQTYNIVNTTAGYVDVNVKKSGGVVKWIADSFKIKSVFSDEKNDHYAEIEVKNKSFRVPFEAFLPQKMDVMLFNKGVAISTENDAHKALSIHLQWLLGQFKVEDARQILGWKNDDKLTWSGDDLLKHNLSLPSEKEYINKLNSLMKNAEKLQFVVCSAASSTLLAYLNLTEKIPVAPFGISLVGTSSTGKTTALQLASSLYSSPDDEAVFSGFYGTQNALTYMLGRHHGVPLCYDESTINNSINKENFVYTFVEGKDKLRLNSDSTLKARNSWLCTCLFSSETHLVDVSENDKLGLGVRIINLENYTYTESSSHADNIKIFAKTNYGIVGNMLADYFINADSKSIKSRYTAIKQEFSECGNLTECPFTDRLILNYAVIIHTTEIMNNLGIIIDIEAIKDICIEVHNKFAECAEPAKNTITKIFNYIASEYKNIKGIKWTTDKDGFPVKVAIVETSFESILKKCKIDDYKVAVKTLDNSGFLIRQSKNRVKSKLSIDGVPCYAYQFDMKKVDDIFGVINDDVFSNVKKYSYFDKITEEKIDVVNDEEAIIHAGNYKIKSNKTAVTGKAFLL